MRTRTTLLIVLCTLLAGVAPAGAVGAVDAPTAHASVDNAAVQQSVPDCSYPLSSTDATGTEVTIEEAPETVTTLGPSAAQTMWEIGGKEQVVGLGQNAQYLAGADSRTNVSAAGFGYSTEAVVGTEADLVLAANVVSNDTVAALRDAGMTVYKFESATSIEDVADKTALIGRLTGNCQGAAETNAWMNANVDTAREVTADSDRPRVLVPLGGGFVVGNETFIDAMVTAAGGENVAAERYGSGYSEASDEVIVELDPEIIVFQPWMASYIGQEPFSLTTAGQNNASVVVNANYLNQPAPRSVVYATRNLTEGFHPDAVASAEWTARGDVNVATATPTPTETVAMSETATATETTMSADTTETSGPGFGAGAAVAALGAGAALLGRRD
ncbi:PGF-CTERM-anchored ABC transporter substrate-binding protein [Halolamina sediminis]|uniref:PGF-CTERM-anchored ABC transporter substrate-binding protein n=1 Tax=Halolamina sediminis TaxID=1480675 RepID=UPI0006B59E05|nr:PGF-CTERM-anchored ABC transporter substrate-binding protein [Halolamina sediminis]